VTPYATIDDLTARFPRALTAAETAAVPIMLEDASFLLSMKVPGLQEAIDGGDETITHEALLLTVAMVSRALVARAAQQTGVPNVDQISQAFGPYSSSIKYRSDNGNLQLYTSEFEDLMALLRGDAAAAVSMRSPGL
jgi:Phage protein Gp19/Gp15/Gp42